MGKQIGAKLILASKNRITKDILYTFKLTFPRIILAEVNTHKIASKNTSSSRAIPVPTMMRNVWKDPFIPVRWGTYQKGMQAGPELTGFKRKLAIGIWKIGRLFDLLEAGIDHYVLHLAKEITNRIYERYVWTEQLFTTTDLSNLLLLRDHYMAEPHFQICAHEITEIVERVKTIFDIWEGQMPPSGYNALQHIPGTSLYHRCQQLLPGEWHLPYVGRWQDLIEKCNGLHHFGDCSSRHADVACNCPKWTGYWKQVSAGRCAWVSYFMPGDNSGRMDNHPDAVNTFKKLALSDPKHLSPLEHQATPLPEQVRCGNLCGFLQFRKEIVGEAGGDIVVPSVTPDQALEMLSRWKEASLAFSASNSDVNQER